MTAAAACPTDEDLAGHLAGVLDAERATAVATHLDGCGACRAIVVGAVRGGVVSLAAVSNATVTVRESQRHLRRKGATLTPGTSVGRYRIKDLLGAGGMGVVYVAHDSALEREVALKVLRPDLAGDAAQLAERLVRESRLMAKASHPGVITVHDVGRDGDQVYVAMELIHGETLGKWLKRVPRTVEQVVAMFRRAGAGLGAAHRAGLVHRDFKPENVLVELDGAEVRRVLVTDFGVARAVAGDEPAGSAKPPSGEVNLTATGVAVGTPAYMAPEQLSGKEPTVAARADPRRARRAARA
jgi:eukaryotic-like serine/threonine-protein kinase